VHDIKVGDIAVGKDDHIYPVLPYEGREALLWVYWNPPGIEPARELLGKYPVFYPRYLAGSKESDLICRVIFETLKEVVELGGYGLSLPPAPIKATLFGFI
jgi:hypothetical protein